MYLQVGRKTGEGKPKRAALAAEDPAPAYETEVGPWVWLVGLMDSWENPRGDRPEAQRPYPRHLPFAPSLMYQSYGAEDRQVVAIRAGGNIIRSNHSKARR